MWIYHFFIYNLGGLHFILNENYNVRGSPNTSNLLESDKIVNEPSNKKFQFPIKIYMKNILPFQREAFEIIKDKFELVEDLSKIPDYEIVSIYGETCDTNPYSDDPTIIFPFLRNLFLEKMNFNIIPGKRIFITRKNSETQHNGLLKRSVLNETNFQELLLKFSFDYIQLENYNTHDKIKLFMESELIISPHSSALTFSLFANKNTKIIELLNKGDTHLSHNNHYRNIMEYLGLNYNRYTNLCEDNHGNFNIDCKHFEEYLLNFL
uniref:Glycosyltransferase 61 catalytic domain-containing protein n=1 Tax=viral metagenome TaxID=1070528 RepID=A0A6C0DHM2_9ZZZZ